MELLINFINVLDQHGSFLIEPWMDLQCPGSDGQFNENCDLITLTIGGNDLLLNQDRYLGMGLSSFAEDHLSLLRLIRHRNPDAIFIVGNVYAPQFMLSDEQEETLNAANLIIGRNVSAVDAQLADIHAAFRNHESEYVCFEIEPNLKGASVIAELFEKAFEDKTLPKLRS